MRSFTGKFLLKFQFALILALFSSCAKKEVTVPATILSKEEMVPLLVDLHLAQAVVNREQLNDSSRISMKDYSSYIFKTHQITKEKYDSSMFFYTQYPELLDEIYGDVINELSKKQSETERK